MESTFRQADRVIVWLGDTRSSEPPWSRIKYSKLGYLPSWIKRDPTKLSVLPGFVPKPEALSSESIALRSAIRNAPGHWWKRVWTIQEAVLSQPEPIFMCGHFEATWSDFEPWLATTRESFELYMHLGLLAQMRNEVSEDRKPSLVDIFDTVAYTRASDPRDKVYRDYLA